MSPSRLLFCAIALLAAAPAFAAPFIPSRDATCVAYSPDGKLVATAISGESSGEAVPKPHPDPRKCGVVFIWNAATGEKLRRMETYGDFTKLEFSPDSKLIAASRVFTPGDDLQLNEVRLWDANTGEVVRTFDRCHAFAFARDGKSIAVLSRSKCVVYGLGGWDKLREIEPLGGAISIAWSHDDSLLIGIMHRDSKTFLRVCDAASGDKRAESVLLVAPFYTLAVSSAGRYVATGHGGGIVAVWDLADVPREALLPGEELQPMRPTARFEAELEELVHPFYSPDGSKLACAGQTTGTVVVWEAASGKQLARLLYNQGGFRPFYRRAAEALIRPERDPARFCFTPAGDAILSGCHSSLIRRVADGSDVMKLGD